MHRWTARYTTCVAPATGKIAFTFERNANLDIYVMNADGSGLTNLTNDPVGDASPAWSLAS